MNENDTLSKIENMTPEEVNKEYDKLMNSSIISGENTTDPITINAIEKTNSELEKEDNSGIVMGVQDQTTGNIASTNEVSLEDLKKLADLNFESFTSDPTKNTTVELANIVKILDPDTAKDADMVTTISSMIQRRLNGEKFSAYNLFPEKIKDQIKISLAQSNQRVSNATLNSMGNYVLDEMVNSYNKLIPANSVMDLDTMLSGFSPEVEKMVGENAKEVGSYMMSMDDQRKQEIDLAIERCKSDGKADSVDKLIKMKDCIDDAYNLDKFSEALKSIKIKKFDLEKPSRVYESFVSMYNKSKNNINDIRICPTILNRHLTDVSEEDNLRLCLGFCKYTRNMNPDNIEDHTFMYYFIRNIIMLDRVNPKGKLYDMLEGSAKDFYDGFTSNLKKAIKNLKK